jgi:hypothetical protein
MQNSGSLGIPLKETILLRIGWFSTEKRSGVGFKCDKRNYLPANVCAIINVFLRNSSFSIRRLYGKDY